MSLRRSLVGAAVAALVVSTALAGCDGKGNSDASAGGTAGGGGAGDGGSTGSSDEQVPSATLTTNVEKGATDVKVSTPVKVKVSDGKLDDVEVKVRRHKTVIDGSFNSDRTVWTASDLLEPGTDYVVKAKASNADGKVAKQKTTFATQDLTLDQQTYASVTPLEHETVGVGMPVIVSFDIPVHRKAAFEKRMSVTSNPPMVGSWNWMSDTEVHWRPKTYWKPGTKVHVDVNVNGANAGGGIYGQMSRDINFKIGKSVIMKPNLKTDEMPVMVDGKLARTIPITGGKAGFETRSGTKLIIEKFAVKRMDAATVGIQPGSPEYYDIPDVQYAQRVTFTGEFLHAAPWSVYAQGSYNVSHGCVGMSTDNAAWLFGMTHRGDPVEVTGTSRGLEQGNGWTDWDMSFKDYKKGSALS
jgi:lipoprotein-anchoring transpeptidase ErfK/SrfK